jgi:hypothetical protein
LPDGSQFFATFGGAVIFWDAESGARVSDYQPDGPVSEWGTISPDGAMFAATTPDISVRIERLSNHPNIKAITSSSSGLLWVVGSSGYAASSRDGGLSWASVKVGDGDLLAVPPLGSEKAVALEKNNTLHFFDQPFALSAAKETAVKLAPTSGRTVGIPSAGTRQLQTLTFINETEGWAAGDDGLIPYIRTDRKDRL